MAKRKAKRKYGPKASEDVARAVREFEEGKLLSGRSRTKVKSRLQAIAIGLSEARKEGARVPARKPRKRR